MKKILFTAAIALFAVALNAQDTQKKKGSNQPVRKTPAEQQAQPQQSAADQQGTRKTVKRQQSGAPAAQPQDVRPDGAESGNRAATPSKRPTGTSGSTPVQQETIMPDGTAAPATSGEAQQAPARKNQARSAGSRNTAAENAPGTQQPAKARSQSAPAQQTK